MSLALSFGIVCVWWVAHHQLFAVLARSDRGLLWLNCRFLFWLAILHLVAVLLAWVDPRISLALYAAMPVMFFIPSKLERSIVTAPERRA